jgi:hypothetical protein
MAIACFGLVTFLPLLPEWSLPRFISCISVSTDFEAAGLYLRVLLFFEADFLAAVFLAGAFLAADFLLLDFFAAGIGASLQLDGRLMVGSRLSCCR